MDLELFDEEQVKKEAKNHTLYLNSVLGIVAFTLGLTCVSMPNTTKASIITLGIIIPLVIQAFKYFPPEITALRKLYKETQNPEVKKTLKELENKYYGFKSMLIGNFIYIYGFSFYLLVLLVPGLSAYINKI